MIILTEEQINKNYSKFKKYLKGYITRDGIDKLIAWLDTTDIATMPATTKYHGVYAGGFIEHCLDVFTRLFKTINADYPTVTNEDGTTTDTFPYTKESIAIVSLLHDLDKVGKYTVQTRNVKVNGEWTQEPFYAVKQTFDRFVFGNPAQNTIYIIEQFMKLTYDEKLAIFHQSGGMYDGNDNSVFMAMNAFKVSPLAYYLFSADFYCMCEVGSKANSAYYSIYEIPEKTEVKVNE